MDVFMIIQGHVDPMCILDKNNADHYTVTALFMQHKQSLSLCVSESISLSPTFTRSDGNTPDSLLARSPDQSFTFSQPPYTQSHYTPTTITHTLSSHLLTVTIHVSLAVAKLQAPTKFFFAANKSFAFTTGFDRYPIL